LQESRNFGSEMAQIEWHEGSVPRFIGEIDAWQSRKESATIRILKAVLPRDGQAPMRYKRP
jgi:hypothetical protein